MIGEPMKATSVSDLGPKWEKIVMVTESDVARANEAISALEGIKNPSAIKGVIEALDSFFNDDDTDLEDWSRRARQALNALNGE